MSALLKRIEATQTNAVPFMTLTQNVERRKHRRHDLADQELPVYAVVDGLPQETALGKLMDISAGGVRFRTGSQAIRPNTAIGLQLSLPSYAGLRPFVDPMDGESFSTEWSGRLIVTRVVAQDDGEVEVAGRLEGLSEGERGLLGLYLSTQPLAA